MDMFFRILDSIGRGLVTLLNVVIWQPFVAVVGAAGQGLADLVRLAMPWLVGGGAVWAVLVYAPELIEGLLVLAIIVFAFRLMIKKTFPSTKNKRR